MEWAAAFAVTLVELAGLAVLVWWARREPGPGGGIGDHPAGNDRRLSTW
jgi:hypothetical protein